MVNIKNQSNRPMKSIFKNAIVNNSNQVRVVMTNMEGAASQKPRDETLTVCNSANQL